jgi:hypothetical protein
MENSIQEDEHENEKSEAITIHLPSVQSYSPEPVKYEPNYIDVVPEIQRAILEQQQQQLDQNRKASDKQPSISNSSSPEYTELIMTRANLMNKNDVDEYDAYAKYVNHFQNIPQNFSQVNLEYAENQTQNVYQTDDKLHAKIVRGKAFPKIDANTRPHKPNAVQMDPEEAMKTFLDNYNKSNGLNDAMNSELAAQELSFRKRNLLIERRYAIRRTISNSRGFKSITTPVNDAERSHNFVFAVANESVSQNVGYNSDLESVKDVIYTPEQPQKIEAPKKHVRANGALSGKAKSESNHSTVTFLFK